MLQLFQKIRINKKIINGEKVSNHFLLSRRYCFDFYSCSVFKKSGGGYEKVIYSVKRDLNTVSNRKKAGSSLVNENIKISLGLIDGDFNFLKSSGENEIDIESSNRIFRIKRHSIENYIFDPILFFLNSIKNEPLRDYIGKLEDSILKKSLLDLFLENENFQLELFDFKIFDDFFKIILKKILEDIVIKKRIYSILYYKKLNESDRNKFHKMEEKTELNSKTEFDFISNEFNKLIIHLNQDTEFENEDEIINFLVNLREDKKYKYLCENKDFDVKYPLIFLYLRGHDIEDQIIYLLNTKINIKRQDLIKKIIKNGWSNKAYKNSEENSELVELMTQFRNNFYTIILSDDLCVNFIPLDLIEVFLDLNKHIRRQANDILKCPEDLTELNRIVI